MALTDDAIVKIRDMIVQGRLNAGDRLPREPDLAAELGISRSSLREAVRALAMMGVLDVRQGDGTFVTSLQPDVLMSTLGFVSEFHQDASVLELFHVRRTLEQSAAELAAQRMGDEDATQLLALVDGLGPHPELGDLVANDIEFHHRIAAASGNAVLCSFIDGLAGSTHRARIWRGLTQGGAVDRTLREHREIAQAIQAHNPQLAGARIAVHIAGVEDWIRDAL
ncbi:FadR family transcriptional regulator [Microbacteriaceae bacterium VKM Ac-2854]|nr:FadR family transcriptional regulator [Microbacteriaceae bacterium VKM Ac-2854]